jgi:SAM-dependent MidA family methyltransferase
MVETSPALRAEQKRRIPTAIWHNDIATLPDDRALLVIANEFFDALPIRQFIRDDGGWRERMITLDSAGNFVPVSGKRPVDPLIPQSLAQSPAGSIVETSPASVAIMETLAQRITRQGGAALVIDYGYEGPATGDSLQAVKGHRYADAFADVGEVDLTAHVDFSALGAVTTRAGARCAFVVPQGEWLKRLGIEVRAQALKQANPQKAAMIDADVERLTSPDAMGSLFKLLAITAPGWAPPAGFDLRS